MAHHAIKKRESSPILRLPLALGELRRSQSGDSLVAFSSTEEEKERSLSSSRPSNQKYPRKKRQIKAKSMAFAKPMTDMIWGSDESFGEEQLPKGLISAGRSWRHSSLRGESTSLSGYTSRYQSSTDDEGDTISISAKSSDEIFKLLKRCKQSRTNIYQKQSQMQELKKCLEDQKQAMISLIDRDDLCVVLERDGKASKAVIAMLQLRLENRANWSSNVDCVDLRENITIQVIKLIEKLAKCGAKLVEELSDSEIVESLLATLNCLRRTELDQMKSSLKVIFSVSEKFQFDLIEWLKEESSDSLFLKDLESGKEWAQYLFSTLIPFIHEPKSVFSRSKVLGRIVSPGEIPVNLQLQSAWNTLFLDSIIPLFKSPQFEKFAVSFERTFDVFCKNGLKNGLFEVAWRKIIAECNRISSIDTISQLNFLLKLIDSGNLPKTWWSRHFQAVFKLLPATAAVDHKLSEVLQNYSFIKAASTNIDLVKIIVRGIIDWTFMRIEESEKKKAAEPSFSEFLKEHAIKFLNEHCIVRVLSLWKPILLKVREVDGEIRTLTYRFRKLEQTGKLKNLYELDIIEACKNFPTVRGEPVINAPRLHRSKSSNYLYVLQIRELRNEIKIHEQQKHLAESPAVLEEIKLDSSIPETCTESGKDRKQEKLELKTSKEALVNGSPLSTPRTDSEKKKEKRKSKRAEKTPTTLKASVSTELLEEMLDESIMLDPKKFRKLKKKVTRPNLRSIEAALDELKSLESETPSESAIELLKQMELPPAESTKEPKSPRRKSKRSVSPGNSISIKTTPRKSLEKQDSKECQEEKPLKSSSGKTLPKRKRKDTNRPNSGRTVKFADDGNTVSSETILPKLPLEPFESPTCSIESPRDANSRSNSRSQSRSHSITIGKPHGSLRIVSDSESTAEGIKEIHRKHHHRSKSASSTEKH